jgi:hypothetical protein
MKTVALAMDAKAAAFRNEHNARAILAWNIAALSRAKRLPKVDSLFARERKPKQTWQEQYELMKQWERAQARRKAAAAMRGD